MGLQEKKRSSIEREKGELKKVIDKLRSERKSRRLRRAIQSKIPEATEQDRELLMESLQLSMVSVERMWALLQSVRFVESNGIEGDFVECGVWRGGSSFLMARELANNRSTERQLWLYDTFNGMTTPSPLDLRTSPLDRKNLGRSAEDLMEEELSARHSSRIWGVAELEQVKSSMIRTGYPPEKIRFVVGDVLETLKQEKPSKIAILRLDTDWYESTQFELEALSASVSDGGVVIADDYGDWSGARKAIDEYITSLDRLPFFHRLDETGRLWIHKP